MLADSILTLLSTIWNILLFLVGCALFVAAIVAVFAAISWGIEQFTRIGGFTFLFAVFCLLSGGGCAVKVGGGPGAIGILVFLLGVGALFAAYDQFKGRNEEPDYSNYDGR